MGADLIVQYLPWCALTEEQAEQVRAVIAQAEPTDDDGEFENVEEYRGLLLSAFVEYLQGAGRRDAVVLQLEGQSYPVLFTAGMSWGDDPTDAFNWMDRLNGCDAVYDLLRQFALRACAAKTPEPKRVIVVVNEGCAHVFEEPDGVDVTIVDRDGSYPYLCPECGVTWGSQSWDADSGVEAYEPTEAELDANDPMILCPNCKAGEAVTPMTRAGREPAGDATDVGDLGH
jgi:hypothetical protein